MPPTYAAIALTKAGRTLISRSHAGTPLIFTKVVYGSGRPAVDAVLQEMTDLVTPELELGIQQIGLTGTGYAVISYIFTNTALETGFFAEEVGVFAQDPDGGDDILYSYGYVNEGTSDWMPPGGGLTLVEQQTDLNVIVENATNVQAVIDSSLVYASLLNVADLGTQAGDAQTLRGLYGGEVFYFDSFNSFWPSLPTRTTDGTLVTDTDTLRLTDGETMTADSLFLGDGTQAKSVLVRRDDGDVDLVLYYRDAETTEWTEVLWSWKRDISEGVVDYEYLVPAQGDAIEIMLEAQANGTDTRADLDHIACRATETGLQGEHHPPATPTMVSPVDGAVGIGEQASLTTSAFSSPVGSGQRGTIFQVSLQGGENFTASLLYTSATVDGISLTMELGLLSVNTTYYMRAMHVDEYGALSGWSDITSFTTLESFVQIVAPRCLAPVAGEVLASPLGLDLESSDWETSGTGEDTHASTNWQISTSPDFAAGTLLVDVVEDAVNLTSLTIADGTVEYGGQYYWRVQHVGTTEGPSDWSAAAAFSVQALANGTRIEGGVCIGPYTRADGSRGFFVVPPWQNRSKIWGLSSLDVPGLNNVTPDGSGENHTGEYNTAHLVANYSSYVDWYEKVGCPAASYCANFSFEGFSDYFMASLPEQLFINQRSAYLTQGYGSSTLADWLNQRIWTSSEYDSVGACITNGTNGATAIKRDGDGYHSFIYVQPVRFLTV